MRRERATVAPRYLTVLLVLGLPARPIAAQNTETAPLPRSGLQIQSVSAYAVYYSRTLPGTGGYQFGATDLLSDIGGGGSAQIGWAKFSERSTFSLVYAPSYSGRVRYSSWNALNHALSLNASNKLAPRWSFNSSINGDFSTLEGFLFAPTVFSNVASVPVTFDDLAAAMLSSKFNNPQLASALSSAPAAQSPVRQLLYGSRMLTGRAQASFSYSHSPRLSFTFGGGGDRIQHISDDRAGSAQSGYLVPDTTSGTANLGFSYSVSPLTQFGGGITSGVVSSPLFKTQSTTTTASLGRTLGRRWFLQIHGGAGMIRSLRQQAGIRLTTKPQPVFGGSLGFKTFSHTLLGSYNRGVSDSYGLGASSNSTAGGTWRWQRPARDWWLESAFSWEQIQTAGQRTSGWRASAGLGRSVGARISLVTQYVYLNYSGRFQNQANSVSQSAARISMVWIPQALLPR
jgi:hypothetical protein